MSSEVFARLRARGTSVNFASPGAGTAAHVLGELLRLRSRLDLTFVTKARRSRSRISWADMWT